MGKLGNGIKGAQEGIKMLKALHHTGNPFADEKQLQILEQFNQLHEELRDLRTEVKIVQRKILELHQDTAMPLSSISKATLSLQ